MLSFKKALDLGAAAIELDVHLCASGELVVIHDFTVDRTTNGTGGVDQLTLAEIKALSVEGKTVVPTLEEVLDFVDRRCLVNIELKGEHTAKAVTEVMAEYVNSKGWSYDDFLVSSFQKEELDTTFKLNPKIHLGVLTQASVGQALYAADKLAAKAIHPHYGLLTAENVKSAQKKGYKVFTWTVNEPAVIARIKSYGVDGIISDYPDRI